MESDDMLSIDEAVTHVREVSKRNREQWKNCPADRRDIEHQTCEQCAEEHDQIAEWLEELKFLKQWKSDIMDSFCKYDVSSFEELIANARNKAIDDFLKEICKMIVQSENNGNYRFFAVEIKQAIADLAEQLKAGGENE